MARNASIPPEILAQVPCKSCRVQKTKDGYKVYKYKAVKLPSGKWGNDSGTLIGIIVPGEGFQPNEAYQEIVASKKGEKIEKAEKTKKTEKAEKTEKTEKAEKAENTVKKPKSVSLPSEKLTSLSYGTYGLLFSLSQDLFSQLNRRFSPTVVAQVYSYAAILCVEGYLEPEQILDRYEESVLSLLFENYGTSMDGGSLRGLLHRLCQYGMPARDFQQQLLEASGKRIALHVPVLQPRSPSIGLDPLSYVPLMPRTRQTYLFIASDAASRCPLFLERTRVLELAEESAEFFLVNKALQDTTFLADPKLYSPEMLTAMSQRGNKYVIPLSRETDICRRIHPLLEKASKDFLFTPKGRESELVSYYEEQIEGGKRVIAYQNLDEHREACKQHLLALARQEEGYTRAEFDAENAWWGCSFLETTDPGTPAELYAAYRESRTIPGFPAIRNLADLADSSVQDYYEQHGLDVVLLVSSILAARLQSAVDSLENPEISVETVLAKSGRLRLSLEADGAWHLRNARPQDVELLQKVGFHPLQSVRSGTKLLEKALFSHA